MKRFLLITLCCAFTTAAAAEDRSIYIITPKGVWMIPMANMEPGDRVKLNADVIVQGFDLHNPDDDGDEPTPPPAEDETVQQLAAVTKAHLQGTDEAVAALGLLDILKRGGTTPADFAEALTTAAGVLDGSLQTDGRITKWASAVLKISTNADKLAAGVRVAFPGADLDDLRAVQTAAAAGEEITGRAFDLLKLLEILQHIQQLLELLGKIRS